MRIVCLLVCSMAMLCSYRCSAQTDSTGLKQSERSHGRYAIPISLIAAGSFAMLDSDADEFFIDRFEIREERNEHFKGFANHLDDYLQHSPTLAAAVLNLTGVKGRHDPRSQLILYAKSEVLMLSVVYGLKYTVGESRPDTGNQNSFPSGHTAQAFTAATFLAKEYGHKSIWIPIGAYSVATTVATFRVLNNRHWISDVLTGAGIGILSTQLVYQSHRPKQSSSPVASFKATPYAGMKSSGLTISCTF